MAPEVLCARQHWLPDTTAAQRAVTSVRSQALTASAWWCAGCLSGFCDEAGSGRWQGPMKRRAWLRWKPLELAWTSATKCVKRSLGRSARFGD
ncbi:hypothetical protein GUJ93_ZPchr0013g35809 [Zizania palustris]|uniref:Uncharacterized protein n=1 Tax=Zizania palustris TaxID=103762 RepID=A0A8J5XA58_ZIZPA|nr:hypothetical protein GUJ93_ZPchr0013g35809 [Zizania palustris]